MSDWLTTWDEPVPETSLDHANAGGTAAGTTTWARWTCPGSSFLPG